MKYTTTLWIGAVAVALAPACTMGEEKPRTGSANITGVNMQTVAGTAKFSSSAGKGVSVEVHFTAAPGPGKHGIHIHNVPSCDMNGMAAGPHWDPTDTSPEHHALPPNGHLGEMGNIEIAADGTGSVHLSNPKWTLGDGTPTDIIPHAIIFHQKEDDGTMTSAGARWGCGLIVLDK